MKIIKVVELWKLNENIKEEGLVMESKVALK